MPTLSLAVPGLRDRILEVLAAADQPLQPKDVASQLPGAKYETVRQTLRRMLSDEQVSQDAYGYYSLTRQVTVTGGRRKTRRKDTKSGAKQSTAPRKAESAEGLELVPGRGTYAGRNCLVLFTDADTGKPIFGVEVPEYLPVFNAIEIRIRPKSNLDNLEEAEDIPEADE